MKKSEILLCILTGLGAAFLFGGMLESFAKANLFGISIKTIKCSLFLILPLGAVFALWLSYIIGKKITFVPQAAKFLMIGIIATLIDIYVFKGLELVSGLTSQLSSIVFKVASFLAATFGKYWGNKFLAFEKEGMEKAGKEMAQFFFITLLSLGLNALVFHLWVNVLGTQLGIKMSLWKTLGVIVAGAAISLWNFLGYKFVVFKK